jgi:hypothetical protein
MLVTAYDAVVALQIVAGSLTPSAKQSTLTNVNGDAMGVTAYDAVLILQYVAGQATGFPIGQNYYTQS